MRVSDRVLAIVAEHPELSNAEVAAKVREQDPTANTSADSVASIKSRSRGGELGAKRPAAAATAPRRSDPKHVVPGLLIRATLSERGVDSVNTATQWAAVNGLVPSMVVAIVRGRREWVQYARADEIATALNSPELWSNEWADWSDPPLAPGQEVDYIRSGVIVEVRKDGMVVVDLEGRHVALPRRRLVAAHG